jgi:hypothetical protein
MLYDSKCNRNIHIDVWCNLLHITFLKGIQGRNGVFETIYVCMGDEILGLSSILVGKGEIISR